MRYLTGFVLAALLTVTAGHALAREGKDSHGACAAGACKVSHTALQGYCPVAYSRMGKAAKGDPKCASVVDGHRYLLMNADAKKMFDMDPSKYQVAYDGYCATAISMGKKMKSDPKLFSVRGGKTYLFSNANAKKAFDAMPDDVAQKADAQWATLSGK